ARKGAQPPAQGPTLSARARWARRRLAEFQNRGERPRRSGALLPRVAETSRNPAMPLPIAVVCGHGESLTPDNPRYGPFFATLRDHRCQVEPMGDKLTTGALAEYQAALIGGARGQLAPDEVQALRQWVTAGGSLLVLSGRDPAAPRWRGVRRPPGPPQTDRRLAAGSGPSPATPARLVDGLTFRRLRGGGITRLDHSALTGWPGSPTYPSNCTPTLDH